MTSISGTSISGTSISATPSATILQPGERSGYSALGQGDFLKLMTAQLQQQDPTSPVDSKEMLAQLAQFQSLGGINDINLTLKTIAAKLDAVLAAQALANPSI